jgi:hypothetical protein
MATLKEWKQKRKASLIVVCTLGLAGIPAMLVADNWRTNIFAGTGLDKGGMGFVLKILSFLFWTVLCTIPIFIIHLVKLIYYQIQVVTYKI